MQRLKRLFKWLMLEGGWELVMSAVFVALAVASLPNRDQTVLMICLAVYNLIIYTTVRRVMRQTRGFDLFFNCSIELADELIRLGHRSGANKVIETWEKYKNEFGIKSSAATAGHKTPREKSD